MNEVIIAGHLGADPEVRFTSSGQKVTTLRVAARVRRGKDETIWWRVTIWGEQFDKMIPHFKKGSSIIVMGELHKPEIFTDKEGRPQVSMNITAFHLMFSPFGKPDQHLSESVSSPSAASHEMAEHSVNHGAYGAAQGQGKADHSFTDDEIPF